MTEEEPIDEIQDPIWYREGPHYQKIGPFPLALISRWYEHSQLLPSIQLSADDGQRWSSIEKLIHRNGPAFPFCSFDDYRTSGTGSIEIARVMISIVRSEVNRLEREMELISEQLKEEERILEKLREMEKILDPDSLFESDEESGEESVKMSDKEISLTNSDNEEGDDSISGRSLMRNEVIRVNDLIQSLINQSVETRFLFCPRFFCPQAFRVVAREESTALHEMNRVCATPTEDHAPVPLVGPLAILDRCDDPAKKLNEDARTALKANNFRKFHGCYRPKLLAITESVSRLMQVDYDLFDHPSPVICALCDVSIGSAVSLLRHVIMKDHNDKIKQVDTSIDKEAYSYWKKVIKSTFLYKPPAKVDVPAKLLKDVSFPIGPAHPLTLLSYTTSVQDPCENLEDALTKMREMLKFGLGESTKGERRAVRVFMHQHPTIPQLFDKAVYCEVCSRKKPIRKPTPFLTHITSQHHIDNACRNGGTASAKAVDFWLNVVRLAEQAVHPRL